MVAADVLRNTVSRAHRFCSQNFDGEMAHFAAERAERQPESTRIRQH